MTDLPIRFEYLTGLMGVALRGARLVGSWNAAGQPSDVWTETVMQAVVGDDGCPAFTATVHFPQGSQGETFRWGVRLDGPGGADQWGIPTEVKDAVSADRTRSFTVRQSGPSAQVERYYLTHCRRFGAEKVRIVDGVWGLRFSVWAPSARAVEVVFGTWESGYVSDTGVGQDPTLPPVPLYKTLRLGMPGDADWDGAWESDVLADYASWDHRIYIFRITRDDGTIAIRTDLHSRCQVGSGWIDPQAVPFTGRSQDLDGKVSCSAIVDPDTVTRVFKDAEGRKDFEDGLFICAEEFWRDEVRVERPLPTRIEDLVIYELHVASLGFGRVDPNGRPLPGTFADAIALLDSHLVPLGVNAIELLPVAEFGGADEWGYGDTHYFALEFRSGGRDQFKHFVRECHRRGIAVILDVVYNHFAPQAARAQWAIDSSAPERNLYYWYEGRPSDWATPEGGYVDNGSSGYAPRLWEENVRKLFVSSAAALVSEFHVDGFRVDLTQALRTDNRVHADGRAVPAANAFGSKFLREWCRTLKLIRPNVFLIAEEHADRVGITRSPEQGGIGFDATWFVDVYHNLVDVPAGDSWARVIARAGSGGDEPLRLDWLGASLAWSGNSTIVYPISHDEAGNSGSGEPDPARRSHRTIVTAVHGAPLVGATRRYAEARCRVATGLVLLSAGTPMFLMGEEVGAANDYRYNDYLHKREDLAALRKGTGARLFAFYRELIAFRLRHPAARSHAIAVLHASPENRVIALHRSGGGQELLVVASLANRPFASGYGICGVPDGDWREVFCSDAAAYGGDNVGNLGATLPARQGGFSAVVPANGFVVFERT